MSERLSCIQQLPLSNLCDLLGGFALAFLRIVARRGCGGGSGSRARGIVGCLVCSFSARVRGRWFRYRRSRPHCETRDSARDLVASRCVTQCNVHDRALGNVDLVHIPHDHIAIRAGAHKEATEARRVRVANESDAFDARLVLLELAHLLAALDIEHLHMALLVADRKVRVLWVWRYDQRARSRERAHEQERCHVLPRMPSREWASRLRFARSTLQSGGNDVGH